MQNSAISKLREHIATLKGKNVFDNNEPVNNACVIAPGMFKLDIEPLSSKLKNHREAHEDYFKKTMEHTDTLHGIELLVYVSETCTSSHVKRKELVYVTPMNKTRKVKSQEPKESTRKTQTQATLQTKQTTNKTLLSSIGVIPSTSACGSQSKNNTRKNRITPAASSNKKHKTVEVHRRKVMSSSNQRNHVSMCNANYKHVVKDANSKFIYSTCNGFLFSVNHDKCVVAYINDVNKRVKSKSGKSKKMEWKPTSITFTSVGHRWLPTG
ncbi:hypothetical protein Tco_1028362 [Tanacetum coccineum]|uniref:Uncharacterized protein n=1 Tax=Tanacetum coccineum TaxID=301880 RepID=A0ABQ5G0D0_9ASTR